MLKRSIWPLLAVLWFSACANPAANAPKLAAVQALPKPSLPPWIASISPTGTADTLAQVRVIFGKPVTAVEALSGDGPRDVLSHVSIAPALRGHFTVLTPRMIGFVPDQALPIGTRVRVTLRAGLHDLSGDKLDQDLAWTFETAPVGFTNMPQLTAPDNEATPGPVDVRPKLQVTANAAVDPNSLADRTRLIGPGGERVGVTAALETQPTPVPGTNAQELFDPSLSAWVYDLRPTQELRRATKYALRDLSRRRTGLRKSCDERRLRRLDSNVRAARNRSNSAAQSQQRRALCRRRSSYRVLKQARSRLGCRSGDHLAGTRFNEEADQRAGLSIECGRHRSLLHSNRIGCTRQRRRKRQRRFRSNARTRAASGDSHLRVRSGCLGAGQHHDDFSGGCADRAQLLRDESSRQSVSSRVRADGAAQAARRVRSVVGVAALQAVAGTNLAGR